MAKTKSVYYCNNCGAESAKWIGRCPVCGEWNTYVEEVVSTKPAASSGSGYSLSGENRVRPQRIDDIQVTEESRIDLGNVWLMPNHMLQAGVKKRFGDRFVLSFSARNLLDQGQKVGAAGEGFVRTVNVRQAWSNIQYNFGVTWNFKSGKAFNRKSVEAASAEDKGRMEKK